MGVLFETNLTVTSVHVYNDRARKAHGTTIHVHVNEKGETMVENRLLRCYRHVAAYRKVVTTMLAALGVTALDLKWSQKLGCICGCAPGFALRVSETDRKQLAKQARGKIDSTKPMTVEIHVKRTVIRPRSRKWCGGRDLESASAAAVSRWCQ